ncbi:hypothetical protein GHK45_13725 [Sinorhizobium meliloti]|uniref:Uncharacterized protein n=1 Tax=Rhizobium meliloti TaxID=382 RepID=A0A6A7ZSW7_RHIML|nr:hypothetical protein [Sinorhizobium meliloti]
MFEAISQYLADTPHLQSLRRHPVPSSSRRRKKLHTSRTPTPDAFRWGRHHLGIRGRLFLGIGGRDHFGIRGRIASEFASTSRFRSRRGTGDVRAARYGLRVESSRYYP